VKKRTILVVDDEPDLVELLVFTLGKEGYTVLTAESGETALRIATQSKPDLVILDLMLPGIDGYEVCRRLKSQEATNEIAVIMLTARTEETHVVTGLELGADDYVTKPFSPKVLVARIRTVLRKLHPGPTSDETVKRIEIRELLIDTARHEVQIRGENIDLSATEFAILEFLARNPGWVFSRTRIIDAVKGKDYPVTERSVDVQILGLRKKLGALGDYIQTVRGVGYRLAAD